MKLITLIDNYSAQKDLKNEHGLSFLLETDDLKIIFDVGQTDKFIDNAKQMNIDLADVDYVVLSHGHYDHTGGLPAFCKINSKAKIIIHKKAFVDRYTKTDEKYKANGISWKDKLKEYQSRLLMIDGDLHLRKNISILSKIERDHKISTYNPRLVISKNDQYELDAFEDEIILVCETNSKPIVLCGCAHNGIVNILRTVKNRMVIDGFSLVTGGLHLRNTTEINIKHIIDELSTYNVEKWGLNHCTGEKAYKSFKDNFKGSVQYFGSGNTYVF